jgi:hypothetical protein
MGLEAKKLGIGGGKPWRQRDFGDLIFPSGV